jgi:hypothetical protein
MSKAAAAAAAADKDDGDSPGSPLADGGGAGGGKGSVPAFLLKTYQMVSDASTDDIVCWNEKGDGFIVKREHEFAQKVLPKYFRHKVRRPPARLSPPPPPSAAAHFASPFPPPPSLLLCLCCAELFEFCASVEFLFVP